LNLIASLLEIASLLRLLAKPIGEHIVDFPFRLSSCHFVSFVPQGNTHMHPEGYVPLAARGEM
jgi:hypothetical protein